MSNRFSGFFTIRVQSIVAALLIAAGIAIWQVSWRNAQRVRAASQPVLRLKTPRSLNPHYRGAELAVRALISGKAAPLSLASEDFDVDGVDDLAAGYGAASGGIIAFHRGDLNAFAPQSEESFRAIARGDNPSPYLPDVDLVAIPEPPDFLVAGDVIGVNGLGVVAAARGGNTIYVLARGASGKMELLQSIPVPGTITALDAHPLKPTKYWHVLAGIRSGGTSGLQIYTGSAEGLRAEASFQLSADADAFAFGNLDTDYQPDTLVLAGGKVSILHSASQTIETVELPYTVVGATLGRFLFDRSSMSQIALLGTDGSLHLVARDAIDSRPITAADLAGRSRLEALRPPAKQVEPLTERTVAWKEVESYPSAATVDKTGAARMFKTRISNNGNDDVMMFGPSRLSVLEHPDERPLTGDLIERSDLAADAVAALARRLSAHVGLGVVYLKRGDPQPHVIAAAATILTVSRFDDPAPASPISNACVAGNSCSLREAVQRANADNAGDTIMVPAGTYTLTRGKIYHNFDGNQGTLEARASMSIVGAGQGSTIIQAGTSSASTCVAAYPPPNPIPLLTSANYEVFTNFVRPDACNSVDKIFSFNQDIPDAAHTLPGGQAFCTVDANGHPNNAPTIFPVDPNGGAVSTTTSGNNVSFFGLTVSSACVSAVLSTGSFSVSNLTLQNGFNRDNVSGDAAGYGGAFDFDTGSSGTATLTLTSVTLQNNSASQGAGATFFNFTAPVVSTAPTVIISNSIIQNNIANWADPYYDMHELGGFLGNGGGLQADVKSRMQMTNSQVLGNTSIQIADSRSGTNTINTDPSSVGGLELIGQLNSGARNVIHSSTISGNKSTTQGGGIYSAAPLVIDTGTVIAGNQALLDGAGVFLTQSVGETATISNSTIINNALVSCSSLNNSVDAFLGGSFCSELPGGPTGFNVPRGGGGIKVSNGSGGLTLSFSRIIGNTANNSGGDALANISSTVTATNNWWGTNSSSTISGLISNSGSPVGTTSFDPFIVLTNTPNPVKIKQGATSQVTASMAQDNHGAVYQPSQLGVLVGLPTAGSIFSASGGLGNFSSVQDHIQSSGTATETFTATAIGLETVTATVDNATADGIIHVLAPPSIAKSFSPTVIPADRTTASTLTFTITNPNAADGLNGLAFNDTFGAGGGLKVAPTPGVVNNCGGTFTATAGSSTVSLSGATINQNTTCTVSVKVVGTADGVQNNTSSTVSATDAGGLTSTGTASASLTVINPPHISTAFGATSIPFGAPTTLTFTVNNPNTALSLTGISFSDTLPAAPGALIVATPNGLSNTCAGTASAAAGSSIVSLTGVSLTAGATCTLSVTVQGAAVGAANNSVAISDTLAGTGNTSTATVTVVKADTSTAVTSSVNPSVFGQNVILTATVAAVAPGAGAPAGTVTFLDGGAPIGTGALNGGVATFTTAALSAANHTITTSYTGDGNFNGSAGSLTGNPQVVNKDNTTTAVTSSLNPSSIGQAVTFTATVAPVAPGTGTPSGTVTFLDGGSSIGTGTLNGGKATFTTSALTVGNHTITTSYNGDNSFNGGAGSLTGNPQVVNKAGSRVTLTSSLNSAPLGQSVTFTATVSAAAPATGTPTGSVTFLDGSATLGTGPLTGGIATFSASSLTAGNHTITASYSGDAAFNGGTGSLTGNPQVVVAPPTISKAFGATNVTAGGTTTLTLTLGNPAANTAPETGVAVTDNFPAGIVVASTPALTSTCGTAANGAASVSLTNGSIPVSGSCTVRINVTLTSSGLKTNTTGPVTSTNGGTGLTASAQISAATPPTITKAFGASSIPFGGSTSLTFAIANSNNIALTGVSFNDGLPAGLVLSNPANATSTCGGALTASAGGSVIGLTGGALPASGRCTIAVNVTGTSLGQKQNITGVISANESGPGTTSNSVTVTVTQSPTTSMLTVSPGSVQYSDPVTLTATLSPASVLNQSPATGVMFVLQNAGGTTNLGGAALVAGAGGLTGTMIVGAPVAAGSYTVIAQFTGIDTNFAVTNATNSLIVTKEDVTVTPSSSNPLAVQVTAPGSNASQAFTLSAVLQEPNDGSLGDIKNAVPVTCTLNPVISGTQTPAPSTATTGTLNTAATPNTLTVSCPFSGVPVNVYDVTISVGGNFYKGSADTVLGVFDPSLGTITGSGTLILPDGNRATFGMQGKFNKGGQVQGGLTFIEHIPGGNDVVVKSNSLGTMSIVGNTVVLIGKATDNGVGNYSFQATGVDNNATGRADQLGLQVAAPNDAVVINFAPIDIAGGNIHVPQGSSN
jgi:hypothetical protein